MTAATPFPLGVYLGSPYANSASATATYESDYADFVATMDAAPQYTDAYTDFSLPVSQWVASAAWQASSNAHTPDAAGLIPIIGLGMASTAAGAPTADQSEQAFAAGTYDSVIFGMVKAWAQQGFTTQVWRPGWEMNISSVPWYAGNDAATQADWVAAFQRISDDLHQAGQEYGVTVQVMWNPGANVNSAVNAITSVYPGDAYVDIVGADVYADAWPYSLYDFGANSGRYDATMAQWVADPANREHYWTDPAANQWSNDASQGKNLSFDQLLQFAEAHGKPVGVAETGAGNATAGRDVADDAAFPQWLAAHLDTAQAAGTKIDFVTIWDTDNDGSYAFSNPGDDKPAEAAAWAANFGAANQAAGTPVAAPPPATDFDGSGTSDILFQNTDGTIDAWLMSGSSTLASGIVANPGTAWHAIATGDFDGSGKAGIVFQNDDGGVDIWGMNGLALASSGIVANPGTAWHVISTGDFDGDGKAGILLQNDDGGIDIWQMDGRSIVSSSVVANPGAAWRAVGTGDFDGDGKSDILFQNDDGSIDIWRMNGQAIACSATVANPGTAWRAVGTGDFDGDGKSDILLQNTDGSVAIWEMNGGSIAASAVVGNPGAAWHAIGAGDYDGDGTADILFQNDDGTIDIWGMSGTSVVASSIVAKPSPDWTAVGSGGMHFIDGTQATGPLAATIASDDFVFTTSLAGSHVIGGFDPRDDVITLDQTRFGSFSAAQQQETQLPGGTLIDLGGGSTLMLAGVVAAALTAKNFV